MFDRTGRAWAIRAVCLVILGPLVVPGSAQAVGVSGTVVDREGKPAAGANVWVAKLGYMEPQETHEATADGSGSFSLAVGVRRLGRLRRQGYEGGRAGWDSIPNVENGKDPAPVTVRLGPPSNFRVGCSTPRRASRSRGPVRPERRPPRARSTPRGDSRPRGWR